MKTSITEGDFGREMLLRIRELEQRSEIKLSRPEKIVLAEIGTIEQVLSILLDSPITVTVKKQTEKRNVIERRVVLGTETGSDIIHATTQVTTKGLPDKVVDDIRRRRLGIGTIITKHGLETFRRVVEVGYDSKKKMLYRVYEILYMGEPKFRIREELGRNRLPRR